MSNDLYEADSDEPVDLPAVLQRMTELPEVVTKWWSVNLQRLVNNPNLDSFAVRRAMPTMMDVTRLIEDWAKRGIINKSSLDLKAYRYWWDLFMHLHGDRPEGL